MKLEKRYEFLARQIINLRLGKLGCTRNRSTGVIYDILRNKIQIRGTKKGVIREFSNGLQLLEIHKIHKKDMELHQFQWQLTKTLSCIFNLTKSTNHALLDI